MRKSGQWLCFALAFLIVWNHHLFRKPENNNPGRSQQKAKQSPGTDGPYDHAKKTEMVDQGGGRSTVRRRLQK